MKEQAFEMKNFGSEVQNFVGSIAIDEKLAKEREDRLIARTLFSVMLLVFLISGEWALLFRGFISRTQSSELFVPQCPSSEWWFEFFSRWLISRISSSALSYTNIQS
jgi:hypothetical protein